MAGVVAGYVMHISGSSTPERLAAPRPSPVVFVLELDKSIADSLSGLRSSSGLIVAGKVDHTPTL